MWCPAVDVAKTFKYTHDLHTLARTCARAPTHAHAHTHTRTCACTHGRTRTHGCTHARARARTQARHARSSPPPPPAHTHTHTHTHTHIHTHTQSTGKNEGLVILLHAVLVVALGHIQTYLCKICTKCISAGQYCRPVSICSRTDSKLNGYSILIMENTTGKLMERIVARKLA